MSRFKLMLAILFGQRSNSITQKISADGEYLDCTYQFGYIYRGAYYLLATNKYKISFPFKELNKGK